MGSKRALRLRGTLSLNPYNYPETSIISGEAIEIIILRIGSVLLQAG